MMDPFDTRAWPSPVKGVHQVDEELGSVQYYSRVRRKEGRILTDAQLERLPNGQGLWNAPEWRIRAASAKRLIHILGQGSHVRILDVGCGNGWLSNAIHRAGHQVVAIDPFTEELEQAARVFPNGPVFARVDLFNDTLPKGWFDAVVFAASIHYFPELKSTLARCFELLQPHGTVHVLDTVIHADQATATRAHERTKVYYQMLGVPEMAKVYHAHTMQDHASAGPVEIVHAPRIVDRFAGLIGRQASPFTHLAYRRPA